MRPQQDTAGRPAIDQGVVHEVELVVGPIESLGAVRHDMRIFCGGGLLDQVAHDDGDATGWELQLVAGLAAQTVVQPVVDDDVAPGTAFEQVALPGVVKPAALHPQAGDSANIKVVAHAVAMTVVAEFTVLDVQHGLPVVAGEDAVLVAAEGTVTYCQTA